MAGRMQWDDHNYERQSFTLGPQDAYHFEAPGYRGPHSATAFRHASRRRPLPPAGQWAPFQEREPDVAFGGAQHHLYHVWSHPPTDALVPSRRSHHADTRLITSFHMPTSDQRPRSANHMMLYQPNTEIYNQDHRHEDGEILSDPEDERVQTDRRVQELEMALQVCETKLKVSEESLSQKATELEAEKRRVYLLEQELKQSIYTSSILATTYNRKAEKMIETLEQERQQYLKNGTTQLPQLVWTVPQDPDNVQQHGSDKQSAARYSSEAAAKGTSAMLLPHAVEDADPNPPSSAVTRPARVGAQILHEDWAQTGDPPWLKQAKFTRKVLTFLHKKCEDELSVLQKQIRSFVPASDRAAPVPAHLMHAAPKFVSEGQTGETSLRTSTLPESKEKAKKMHLFDSYIWAVQQARARRGLRAADWWRDKTLIDQRAQTAALGAACFGMLGFAAAVYQNELIYSGSYPDDSVVCVCAMCVYVCVCVCARAWLHSLLFPLVMLMRRGA